MRKRKRVLQYDDIYKPTLEQLRENARRTPEECWELFLEIKRKHYEMLGLPERQPRRITIGKPY
ncbi:MAG: hypothetical protein H7319_21560 [Spirosoma sp.]|nr:hypothetical protein [Spirosoma sp.]